MYIASPLGRKAPQKHAWAHKFKSSQTLQWRHNKHDDVSNHQPHDCFLNRLFRQRSKKISKLRVTGLCVGNSPGNGEFPAEKTSNAENVSIWWRHHAFSVSSQKSHFSMYGWDILYEVSRGSLWDQNVLSINWKMCSLLRYEILRAPRFTIGGRSNKKHH